LKRDLAVCGCPVRDKTLKPSDRDRVAVLTPDALGFTLSFLRTDAAGCGRKRIPAVEDFGRRLKISHGNLTEKSGNSDLHRTSLHARLIFTIQTAFGFFDGREFFKPQVDFLKIPGALRRVLFPHFLSRDRHPFFGREFFGCFHKIYSNP
jgi:hypothetical protein